MRCRFTSNTGYKGHPSHRPSGQGLQLAGAATHLLRQEGLPPSTAGSCWATTSVAWLGQGAGWWGGGSSSSQPGGQRSTPGDPWCPLVTTSTVSAIMYLYMLQSADEGWPAWNSCRPLPWLALARLIGWVCVLTIITLYRTLH